MTDTALTGVAAILALLAAVANGYAAFRARPLNPDLGDNVRELTRIVEGLLSGTKRPMKTITDKLHREGSLQRISADLVVAIEQIEETISRQHTRRFASGRLSTSRMRYSMPPVHVCG